MVIKTDELPAAAPADSAREPSSQAGGKGRPGSAGEWGRDQRGVRRCRLDRAERGDLGRGSTGTAAFSPRRCRLHLAGPSTGPPPP